VLDYEFDSDDEWEEEEPGESVSSASEGEESGGEESGGEEGEEDGFFVPHGYLSEDEGERSESEGGGAPPGTQVREGPSISSLLITNVWWYTNFHSSHMWFTDTCVRPFISIAIFTRWD
jgi:hypothetical protein